MQKLKEVEVQLRDSPDQLIIAHEVTNVGDDRAQLSNMANLARDEIGVVPLTVVADRGYYKGTEIVACEQLLR